MTEDDDKVFTIVELAGYLKIPKSTLYKLVRSGSIPCCEGGKALAFSQGRHRRVVNTTGSEGEKRRGTTMKPGVPVVLAVVVAIIGPFTTTPAASQDRLDETINL